MFIRSAAADTLQGHAIQNVNKRWGTDILSRDGRETIGIAVCKKKYSPFTIKKEVVNGRIQINIQRMYGCHLHSDIRKNIIEQFGVRRGWEPFGQWSLSKAEAMAKKICCKLNDGNREERDDLGGLKDKFNYRQICMKGSCVWKLKAKYDDIMEELLNEKDSIDKIPNKPSKKRKLDKVSRLQSNVVSLDSLSSDMPS